MKYEKIKKLAKSGDIVLVAGSNFWSIAIRALTAEMYSHVAMLFWDNYGGLWVSEMKESLSKHKAYRHIPASAWVEEYLSKGDTIYFGIAPQQVRNKPIDFCLEYVNKYRAQQRKYDWLGLIRVWLADILNIYMGGTSVCSGHVQEYWEKCGLPKETASPGSLANKCEALLKITR